MPQDQDSGENEKWMTWNESMEKILLRLRQHSTPLSIPIVPEKLRKWNENAYLPKTMSMGPRHNGTRMNLGQLDEIKRQCTKSFLHRPKGHAKHNFEKCWKCISTMEEVIRASYPGDLKLKWEDLANIMLWDACFLLEILIGGSRDLNNEEKLGSRLRPPIEEGAKIGEREDRLTDLMMLENQIPLFILRDLFKLLFPEAGDVSIETLALNLYGYAPDNWFNNSSVYYASHLLDLIHSYISEESAENKEEGNNEESHGQHHNWVVAIDIGSSHAELNRCATILEAAGVKIKPRGQGARGSNAKKNLSKSNNGGEIIPPLNFDIKFSKSGKLKILPLHITKETEVRWLNLIAWEQSHAGLGFKHNCTWAACLFNSLICCKSDIQVLKERGVIFDHLNMGNQKLLEFFRSMVMGVDRDKINNDSVYWKMVNDLNKHSSTNYLFKQFPLLMWHSKLPKAMPGIAKYCKRGLNLMLALITIISVVQTYYAIVSYEYPKN